jgi:hypothetical protein
VLVIVTHTALLRDEVKETYSDGLFRRLSHIVNRENIIHINFAKWSELADEFRGIFTTMLQPEREKALRKLVQLNAPVNPLRYVLDGLGINEKIAKDFGKR